MSNNPSRHRAFDLLAPFYDLGIWLLALPIGGERALRHRVIEGAGPLKGSKVLEIFAGTATLSLMAAEKGAEASAVDISPRMLRVAAEKGRKEGQRLGLAAGDSAALPVRSGAFDTVIVSLGLHETHQASLPEIFKEVQRVLKQDGRFVIFDFHRARGRAGVIQKLFFSFFEDDEAWNWLASDVQTLLKDAGFKGFRRSFSYSEAFQLITVEKRG